MLPNLPQVLSLQKVTERYANDIKQKQTQKNKNQNPTNHNASKPLCLLAAGLNSFLTCGGTGIRHICIGSEGLHMEFSVAESGVRVGRIAVLKGDSHH